MTRRNPSGTTFDQTRSYNTCCNIAIISYNTHIQPTANRSIIPVATVFVLARVEVTFHSSLDTLYNSLNSLLASNCASLSLVTSAPVS